MANFPIYMNTGNPEEQVLFQDQQNQVLQGSLSDNGWTLPQQPTTNITKVSPNMPDGTMWYDATTNNIKVKISGAVKTVTVT